MMPTITIRGVTVDVIVNRWTDGRRNVRRADNGRLLGWVTRAVDAHGKDTQDFQVHVSAAAFRGDGPDDQGDILDHVPAYLANELQPGECHPIATERRMEWALHGLIGHLAREQAPAVGYPRHPLVTRWRR